MATPFLGLLSPEDIQELLDSPEVLAAKQKLGTTAGDISFTIPRLPLRVAKRLQDAWGLDLAAVALPMRWIQGDTRPHTDRGTRAFEKTHLAYLTDSPGALRIDGVEYPIVQGAGYMFSEGLPHETVGTGMEPRLLLGPMSEAGMAVGGGITIISADGATETIHFTYIEGTGLFYRINDGGNILFSFPAMIINTNPSGGTLKALFDTDITLSLGTYQYFICGSDNIQFGSTSLKNDGTRPVIRIDIDNYDGFIQNGIELTPGFNNISICNLVVDGTGHTPQISAGWLCKNFFGNGTTGNFIVNCHSMGDLPDGGAIGAGGLVGAYAGSESGAQLFLYGCSSAGANPQFCGGIVGSYAGANGGLVICEGCWSTGVMSVSGGGGGIFGSYAGNDGGQAVARGCYSAGAVGDDCGGIFGRFAGNNGQAIAQNCYSRGTISVNAGGIFGSGAGSDGGTTSATNCYSSGSFITLGTGIYGSPKVSGTETNCYVANGSWSDIDAVMNLVGVPAPHIGTVWVVSDPNQPYELKQMGYTPYSTVNITTTPTPALIRTASATVAPGGSTMPAIRNGLSYLILEKEGAGVASYGTLTINAMTGAISTLPETEVGTYTLWIRNTGSYNITAFELNVTEATNNCCDLRPNLQGLDYTTRAAILAGNAMVSGPMQTPMSQSDYLRMVRTYAFRR